MSKYLLSLFFFLPILAWGQTPNTTTYPCLDTVNIQYGLVQKHAYCSFIAQWPNSYELWEMGVDSGGIREPGGGLPRFTIFRPAQPGSAPRGLIMMLHGGSSDRETPEFPEGTLNSVHARGPCEFVEFQKGFIQLAALLGYIVVTPLDSWASQWAGCGEKDLDYGPRHYGSWVVEAAMHYMLTGQSGLNIDPNRVYMGGVCGGSIGTVPNGLRDPRIKKIILDAHTDEPQYFALAYPWSVSGYRHYSGSYPWEDWNAVMSYSYAEYLRKGGAPKPTLLFQNKRDNVSFSMSDRDLVRYLLDSRLFDQNLQHSRVMEFDHDGPLVMFGHGSNLILSNAALTYLWLEERRWWLYDALDAANRTSMGREYTNDDGDSTFNTDDCLGDKGLLVRSSDGSGIIFERSITLDRWREPEASASAWYLTDSAFLSPGSIEVLNPQGAVLARRDLRPSPPLKRRAVTDVTFTVPDSGSFKVRVTVNGRGNLLLDYTLIAERAGGGWNPEILNGYFPD